MMVTPFWLVLACAGIVAALLAPLPAAHPGLCAAQASSLRRPACLVAALLSLCNLRLPVTIAASPSLPSPLAKNKARKQNSGVATAWSNAVAGKLLLALLSCRFCLALSDSVVLLFGGCVAPTAKATPLFCFLDPYI